MTTPPRYLTKSRLKLACECPTKLFYTDASKGYANRKRDDEFLKSLAEAGFQVGELAKMMFPGGIEVGEVAHAAALEKTRSLIDGKDCVLFEPAFSSGDLFVRVDVLRIAQGIVDVIEVKSKSWDSRNDVGKALKQRDLIPYLQDVAFQTMVVRQCLPEARVRAHLMLPDKARSATVDGLSGMFPLKEVDQHKGRLRAAPRAGLTYADIGEPVLACIDVTEQVDAMLADALEVPGAAGGFEVLARHWAEAYRKDQKLPANPGAHCKQCEFRAKMQADGRCGLSECWKESYNLSDEELREPLVIDLWDGRRAQKHLDAGVRLRSALSTDDIGHDPRETALTRTRRQWLEISEEGLGDRGWLFDLDAFQKIEAGWTYPLHMIDFETAKPVLPLLRGERPLQQLAFQFSHHILHEDGQVEHAGQFLSTEPGVNPNHAFVSALRDALASRDGSVMMWHHHENSVLNAIRRDWQERGLHPELVEFLLSMTRDSNPQREGQRAMADLRVAASQVFFHRRAGGSSSIKKALPAMLMASDFLKNHYAQPRYGQKFGNSLNFAEPIAWWQPDATGAPRSPYELLPPVFTDLDLQTGDDDDEAAGPRLAEGGTATMAFSRLQAEDVPATVRQAWQDALLRYCELDTLAMVMIVQGWQAWSGVQNR
jgi:hypothetical protein